MAESIQFAEGETEVINFLESSGTMVVANPDGTAAGSLESIGLDGVKYELAQTSSNAEIGDIAFSNPPSDLSDNEKAAVRVAIGAGTPGDGSGGGATNFSDLAGQISDAQVPASFTRDSELSAVATSGNYADLSGRPDVLTLTQVNALINDAVFSGNYSDLVGAPNLAAVATSGNYADLSGRPDVITLMQVNTLIADSVFSDAEIGDKAFSNPPTDLNDTEKAAVRVAIGAGTPGEGGGGASAFSDLTGQIADSQVPDSFTRDSELADVATSGAYSDLSGTPNLATVATSGSYDDLTNKPDIDDTPTVTYGIHENNRLPGDPIAMRIGWHQTADLTEATFVRSSTDEGNSQDTPADGETHGMSSGLEVPDAPPSISTSPTLYWGIWFEGDPDLAYVELRTDDGSERHYTDITDIFLHSGVFVKHALTVNGVAGNFIVSHSRVTWDHYDNEYMRVITVGDKINTWSNTEIGDIAFTNPPSDLSDAEKTAVRTAIGAGTGGGGASAFSDLTGQIADSQVPDTFTRDSELADVATSGDYEDLSNRPTITHGNAGEALSWGRQNGVGDGTFLGIANGESNARMGNPVREGTISTVLVTFSNGSDLATSGANPEAVIKFWKDDGDVAANLIGHATISLPTTAFSTYTAIAQLSDAAGNDVDTLEVETGILVCEMDSDGTTSSPNFVGVTAYFAASDTSSGSGEDNVQADWNVANTASDAFILNKPTDDEIGDTAFSNPPSNLSDAEKAAVRTAIGDESRRIGFANSDNTLSLARSGTSPFNIIQITADFTLTNASVDDTQGNGLTALKNNDLLVWDEVDSKWERIYTQPAGGGGASAFSDLTGQIADSQVPDSFTRDSELSTVATSGAYSDLSGRPTIPSSFSDLSGSIADGQIPAAITRDSELAQVALSGDYEDLTGAPTDAEIGDTAFSNPPSDLSDTEKTAVRTAIGAGTGGGGATSFAGLSGQIADSQVPDTFTRDSELAAVATSGDYNDLSNTPTIPGEVSTEGLLRNTLDNVATSASLTKTAYDAITNKDNDRLYLITQTNVLSTNISNTLLGQIALENPYDNLTGTQQRVFREAIGAQAAGPGSDAGPSLPNSVIKAFYSTSTANPGDIPANTITLSASNANDVTNLPTDITENPANARWYYPITFTMSGGAYIHSQTGPIPTNEFGFARVEYSADASEAHSPYELGDLYWRTVSSTGVIGPWVNINPTSLEWTILDNFNAAGVGGKAINIDFSAYKDIRIVGELRSSWEGVSARTIESENIISATAIPVNDDGTTANNQKTTISLRVHDSGLGITKTLHDPDEYTANKTFEIRVRFNRASGDTTSRVARRMDFVQPSNNDQIYVFWFYGR